MQRPIFSIVCLTLLLTPPAAADPSNPPLAKARRLTKYFKNALSAVVNGGVAPCARVTNIGCQARCLIGLQAGVTLAKVVDRGLVQRCRALYGGGDYGIQLGLGPEVSWMTYVGKRGMTGKELLLTRESTNQGSVAIYGARAARSNLSAHGFGEGISTYMGFSLGVVARKILNVSQPEKTPMLERLEEGLRLSGELNASISAGRLQGLGATVNRLEYLHALISAEKKALNVEHRSVMQVVNGAF